MEQSISVSPPSGLDRPQDSPRSESVEGVSVWVGGDDSHRVELGAAPAFWALLPLAMLGCLIQQTRFRRNTIDADAFDERNFAGRLDAREQRGRDER